MFHPIERIEYTGLDKLNKLAYLTVTFGLGRQTDAPEGTIKQDFINYYTANGYPDAGLWLWDKPKTIRLPLLDLLGQPLADKQEVLIALMADQDLEHCFHNNQFHYPLLSSFCKTVLDLVSQILGNFYTIILAEGVPGKILGELNHCDRQSVLKAYLDRQKIQVCPACDGMPPSIDDYADKIREDLDHFFPKSKYPFWAIHPLNLTPFCKVCNQTYKGAKDAITDQVEDVINVIALEHIYHPYLRPAHSEVDLIVERDAVNHEPHLKIIPKFDDPVHRARLHSLNYLLNLESRWNGEIKAGRLRNPIKAYLIYSTYAERDEEYERNGQSFVLTEKLIDHKFSNIEKTITGEIGSRPGSLPASAYARWVTSDSKEKIELLKLAQQSLR